MCYYHPTSLLYAPSIPHQYFVRPCRHAKFHATQMAYPVSSGSTAGSPNTNIVSMQRSYGILVRPCSSHHIADEGEDGGEGDICMDVPFGFDFDSQEEDDDEKCEGYEDEEECEDEEEESDEDEESDDEDEDEDEDEKEGYARTGLAISVPITSIQPGSGPSLRDIKPKPQSKRFKRDLISMPAQYLRMKWKRSMALRYIQKRAADATAASVSAGPHRPQVFNNNGFGSWFVPGPVQTQVQTQTIGRGQGQSPRFYPWDTLPLQPYKTPGGFT